MDVPPGDAAHPDVTEGVPPITTPTVQDDASVQYYPSDEPLRLAIEQFNRGSSVSREQYFRDAVEKAPKDASAWIGLAASYDHLGRFDLADQAYKAVHLVGRNDGAPQQPRIFLHAARRFLQTRADLLKAYAREPGNPIIANNLRLLDGSERIIRRDPSAF